MKRTSSVLYIYEKHGIWVIFYKFATQHSFLTLIMHGHSLESCNLLNSEYSCIDFATISCFCITLYSWDINISPRKVKPIKISGLPFFSYKSKWQNTFICQVPSFFKYTNWKYAATVLIKELALFMGGNGGAGKDLIANGLHNEYYLIHSL